MPGEYIQGYVHVFISVRRYTEVNILDVKAHIYCPFGTEDTVSQYLVGGEVCCVCCQIPCVDDSIASRSDSDSVWVVLLLMVNNINSAECYNSVFGGVVCIGWVHNKE